MPKSFALVPLMCLTLIWVPTELASQSPSAPRSEQQGGALTAEDVEAELLASQAGASSAPAPAVVERAVYETVLRKALAHRARTEGLHDAPLTRARMERAADVVLADAIIDAKREELREQMPDMTVRAQELYASDPERFGVPEQRRVSHIFLRAASEQAKQDRRSEIAAIRQRILGGESFAEVAKVVSEDPRTAEAGGALGLLRAGQTLPEFEAAAFSLESPGDVSELVESPQGLHLILLEERIPRSTMSYAEVEKSLLGQLQLEWLRNAVSAWREGVMDVAKQAMSQALIDSYVEQFADGSFVAPHAQSEPQPQ